MSSSLIFLPKTVHCIDLEKQSFLAQYEKNILWSSDVLFLLDYLCITVWIKYTSGTYQNSSTTVAWILNCLGTLFFFFLGLHLRHMEVPRLGVQSELQLLAYITTTEMPDLSHVCDLHHSSQQHQIPNTLSKARHQTHIFMDTRILRILMDSFCWATRGTPV